MSIVLSHITALEILRRWDAAALIARGRRARPLRVPGCMPTDAELAEAYERTPMLADCERPIHVLVSSVGGRHASGGAVAHLSQGCWPTTSFFSLAPDVTCSGPELVLLQMSEYATELELLMLVDELCGYYAVQPAAKTGLVKRYDPLTSVDKVATFLTEVGPRRGSVKLGRVLSMARDQSGSPAESRAAHLLELPPIRGGNDLPIVAMNDSLLVARADGLLAPCSERVRKPDILLLAPDEDRPRVTPFRAVALDYQGGYHRDPLQEGRDINRRNELLACDIKDYEIASEHAADLDYLDWLVGRIRRDLGIERGRVRPEREAARRARREALHKQLLAADGLHWTNRSEPLVMRGAGSQADA